MKIENWVTYIAEECFRVRGIETGLQRIDAISENISKDSKYDEHSRSTAKNWILYGDWTYRRNEQLTLNDFYPSYEQVSKGLSTMDFVVLRKEELQLKIQKAKRGLETITNVCYEPMPMPKKEARQIFTMDLLKQA